MTKESIPSRISRLTARNPWKAFILTLITATILSAIGLIVGEFKIAVDNNGWRSRGTIISKRAMQMHLIDDNEYDLRNDYTGSVWDRLENERNEMEWVWRRQLLSSTHTVGGAEKNSDGTVEEVRELERDCSLDWYASDPMLWNDNMFSAWKSSPNLPIGNPDVVSLLDPSALSEICDAEVSVMEMLEDLEACNPGNCDDGKCLPPHSLVLVLKYFIGEDLNMSCNDLMNAYTTEVQEAFTSALVTCVEDIKEFYDPITEELTGDVTCPDYFETNLVDAYFGESNQVLRYSSSYYQTSGYNQIIFDNLKDERLDRGDGVIVEGAYETVDDFFVDTTVDAAVQTDMLLACGSLGITTIAMAIHTKSIWLTMCGLVQIIFSIPLAYFFYYFIAGLSFFPFLNFIGVFVVAALGADDVFVAVDKWKNARLEHPNATTEEVAAIALPDAAGAMLLTTATTAAAFFATAICRVAPILCFAVFCGLLIVFDYLMNVFLVFPALCIYDRWLMNGKRNCCITFSRNVEAPESEDFKEEQLETSPESVEDHPEGEEESKPSLIHRILSGYYFYLHKLRYILLLGIAAAMGLCIYTALQFKLPETTDVRLLPEGHEFELNYKWEASLLANQLTNLGGSNVPIYWGLIGSDDGDWNNPQSLTKLKVNDDFDPTSTEAQEYLLNFCEKMFAQDFVTVPYEGYTCPMNLFDSWLKAQSSLPDSDTDFVYNLNCDGASSVPMSPEVFTPCFLSFADEGYVDYNDLPIAKLGKIQVMKVTGYTDVNWKTPVPETIGRWKDFESFFKEERSSAPTGVNNMFHSNQAFWFADTNQQMINCAFGAAAIAIGVSTLIVFIASRSIPITLFAALSIFYVLGATTASLVALGWTLGFLESICFAILIGISCDFVIHFCHAYNHLEGTHSRSARTKFAVIHMGPSILAAALTTFSAAAIMFACKVLFFTKFAMILFQTMLHSTIGSFVVFLVLADVLGPTNPTRFVDNLLSKCRSKPDSSSATDKSVMPPATPETKNDGMIDLSVPPEDKI